MSPGKTMFCLFSDTSVAFLTLQECQQSSRACLCCSHGVAYYTWDNILHIEQHITNNPFTVLGSQSPRHLVRIVILGRSTKIRYLKLRSTQDTKVAAAADVRGIRLLEP